MQSNFEVFTISDRVLQASQSSWLLAGLYIVLASIALMTLVGVLGLVLIYAERKIAAHIQCRLGPMRVGWHGTLQTVADAVKLLFKEDIVPDNADRLLHLLGPFFALLATIMVLVVVPFSPWLQIADPNVGVVYVTAITGLGVFGILIGGWSSNNRWSLLGAMRSGAQIISYEISVTLALLVIVMLSGSLQLSKIIESQSAGWWIWRAHGVGIVAFTIFFIASIAEINRTPFDIPEGESELTGGFHTEYSGMRFAFYFLSEFVNMFIVAAMTTTFFLGGWLPFQIGEWQLFNSVMGVMPPVLWFGLKASFVIFLMIWFRWTFPRLRVDQLMRLEWKFLMPIGFVNFFLAAVVVVFRLYFFPV